jgi:glycosyltransferase involved in cell wall biosynthesis
MRIIYVSADQGVPVYGRKGCSIHVQEGLRALRRQGAEVELLTRRSDGEPPSDLKTLRVHLLELVRAENQASREQALLAANAEIRRALEQVGPYDLVYERYSLWSFAAMEYAQDIGVPGLLEVNAPLIEEQAKYRTLVDRAGAERVAHRAFGAATALIAVSEEVAAYLDQYPAARGRIYVIPNGVDPNRFPKEQSPSQPGGPGTFTVGFVGSLKPWHGLTVLVEAFARLHEHAPESRLLIVGDGPERAKLEAEVSAHGLRDSACFTGAVAPREVPGLLASMDAAVAPYPNLTPFYFSPLKVFEYMAAGLPVIASRVGQLSSLIQDGSNGLLCPPEDPAALAALLDRLRQDPALRARLGRTARAAVIADHSWDLVAQRSLSLAGLGSGQDVTSRDQRGCLVP